MAEMKVLIEEKSKQLEAAIASSERASDSLRTLSRQADERDQLLMQACSGVQTMLPCYITLHPRLYLPYTQFSEMLDMQYAHTSGRCSRPFLLIYIIHSVICSIPSPGVIDMFGVFS